MRRAVILFFVAVGLARAQSPDLLVQTEGRHLILLAGMRRALAAATLAADRGSPPDWDAVARRVAAAAGLDADMRAREAALASQGTARPIAAARLATAIANARAAVARAIADLAARRGAPLGPPAAFGDQPTAPPPPAVARTGAAARARLRTLPARSVEDLFDATAALPRDRLPVRGR